MIKDVRVIERLWLRRGDCQSLVHLIYQCLLVFLCMCERLAKKKFRDLLSKPTRWAERKQGFEERMSERCRLRKSL